MTVRALRLERGWSQEHLAQLSGLSIRTVQRIECGRKAGLESRKCLAAAFETDVANLIQEDNMANDKTTEGKEMSREDRETRDYVDNLKGFHLNWICFVIVIPCLYLLNMHVTPDELWVIYPAAGWLLGIVLHGVVMMTICGSLGVFGRDWEQRKIEKRFKGRG